METHYYIINGKVKKGGEMPIQHLANVYADWYLSLQPCEIYESELDKVRDYIYHLSPIAIGIISINNPIDITDIVEEIPNCLDGCCVTLKFKQPKQVDVEIEVVDKLLNTFGQYCTLNGIKLTDSNKVGQAVIDFLKSDIYEIFKNRK